MNRIKLYTMGMALGLSLISGCGSKTQAPEESKSIETNEVIETSEQIESAEGKELFESVESTEITPESTEVESSETEFIDENKKDILGEKDYYLCVKKTKSNANEFMGLDLSIDYLYDENNKTVTLNENYYQYFEVIASTKREIIGDENGRIRKFVASTEANGNEITHEGVWEYEFFADGTVKRETMQSETGEQIEIEYDNNGNIILLVNTTGYGYKKESTYENNRLISEVTTTDNFTAQEHYEYDSNGNKIERVKYYYRPDGNKYFEERDEYDDRGNLIKTIEHSMDEDERITIYENQYDEDGRLKHSNIFGEDYENNGAYDETYYDSQGRKAKEVKHTYYYGQNNHYIDSEGNYIEIEVIDSDRYVETITYEYDENGNLIKETINTEAHTYPIPEYDQDGNVTVSRMNHSAEYLEIVYEYQKVPEFINHYLELSNLSLY